MEGAGAPHSCPVAARCPAPQLQLPRGACPTRSPPRGSQPQSREQARDRTNPMRNQAPPAPGSGAGMRLAPSGPSSPVHQPRAPAHQREGRAARRERGPARPGLTESAAGRGPPWSRGLETRCSWRLPGASAAWPSAGTGAPRRGGPGQPWGGRGHLAPLCKAATPRCAFRGDAKAGDAAKPLPDTRIWPWAQPGCSRQSGERDPGASAGIMGSSLAG